MCISSNHNYQLNSPIDVSALGLENITTSVTDALKNASQNNKHSSHHPHIVVEHHYHDHAHDKVDKCVDERPARGGVTTPFPLRLHAMLDKLEADGHADVISWQPHGRCFVVRKPKEFKELLPKYFKLSKMASFQRQLNLYGFQRLTRGRDKNGYYNEYFLRGKPALAHNIQRTKVKGTGVRARSNPTSEPHLWEMTWVGTDHDGPANVSDSEEHHTESTSSSNHAVAVQPKSAAPVASSSTFTPLMTPQLAMAPPSSLSSAAAAAAWQKQAVQPQKSLSEQRQQEQRDEDDVVLSFGGKRFHYLDPFEMMQEAQLRKKQYQACQQDDMQSFMSNLQLDDLCQHLDDQIMDDDDAFINMLERVIE